MVAALPALRLQCDKGKAAALSLVSPIEIAVPSLYESDLFRSARS